VNRSQRIQRLRVAGYHHDTAAYTRLLIEAHVNRAAAREAYLEGVRAKFRGLPCACAQCHAEVLA
jgi:hypothetical protein